MNVTFFGHRKLHDRAAVAAWLDRATEILIANGADSFYIGGYGEFDELAASVLAQKRQTHANIHIILVRAYIKNEPPDEKFDETVYPGLENVPPRLAILRRNKWMAKNADFVAAYVIHEFGGAATALDYARKAGKKLIIYPELPSDTGKTASRGAK